MEKYSIIFGIIIFTVILILTMLVIKQVKIIKIGNRFISHHHYQTLSHTINKYKSIGLGELKLERKLFKFYNQTIEEEPSMILLQAIKNKLVAFDKEGERQLCISIDKDCLKCIHGPKHLGCTKGKAKSTADKIFHAKHYLNLISATRARATYLATLRDKCERGYIINKTSNKTYDIKKS